MSQIRNLKEKLEDADDKIASLELELKRVNRDLEYYRRVARKVTDSLNFLGISVWVGEGETPLDHLAMLENARRRIDMGKHMEIIQAANEANPLVNDAWNKYLVALRLCGFDGTKDDDAS